MCSLVDASVDKTLMKYGPLKMQSDTAMDLLIMKRPYDLRGQRYGNLYVLYALGQYSDGTIEWACLCTCGNHTRSTTRTLRRGQKRSCGCIRMKITPDFEWSIEQAEAYGLGPLR